MPTTKLTYWFETGSTLILHLYEVVVTISADGDTYTDTVTHLDRSTKYITLRIKIFTFDDDARGRSCDIMGGLHELGIDSSPRSTLGGFGNGERLTVSSHRRLHIADGSCGLRQFEGLSVHLNISLCSIKT